MSWYASKTFYFFFIKNLSKDNTRFLIDPKTNTLANDIGLKLQFPKQKHLKWEDTT